MSKPAHLLKYKLKARCSDGEDYYSESDYQDQLKNYMSVIVRGSMAWVNFFDKKDVPIVIQSSHIVYLTMVPAGKDV